MECARIHPFARESLIRGPKRHREQLPSWNQKVVLVSGGSAGLGLEVGRSFARRGAKLALVARDTARLEQAAAKLAEQGTEVLPISADVTEPDSADRIASQTQAHFGRLDVLVNAAGRSTRQAIADTTPEDFQALWEINFQATVRCTRACLEALQAARGHVVQIGSLASLVATPVLGGYPASKFPLAAYSQQLRLALGPQGLHVLLVCPGPLARDDAQPRYQFESEDLPPQASQPAGGARLSGLDPSWVADRIVRACERRQPQLVLPARVRAYLVLNAISPRWGDWLLKRFT